MGFNAHNLFGQLLGELGIVGALAFGCLVFNICLINWRVVRAARGLARAHGEAEAAAAARSPGAAQAAPPSRTAPAHAARIGRRTWTPKRKRGQEAPALEKREEPKAAARATWPP